MRIIVFLGLVVLGACSSTKTPMLFELSNEDSKFLVFGTLSRTVSFDELPSDTKSKILDVDQVYMENEDEDPELENIGLLPPEESLSTKLSPEAWTTIRDIFPNVHEEDMNRWTPSLAYIKLDSPKLRTWGTINSQTRANHFKKFMEPGLIRALNPDEIELEDLPAGASLTEKCSLELVENQLLAYQRKRESGLHNSFDSLFEMRSAYLTGDLKKFHAAWLAHKDRTCEVNSLNKIWASFIVDLMKNPSSREKRTLFAVPVESLAGDNSLLKYLQDEGFAAVQWTPKQ